MAEQSTQSIEVDAEPSRVMAVIADFPAYPEWDKAVRQTEVLDTDGDGRAKQVKLTLDAGPIKDVYTLEYDWDGDGLGVSWHLVKGQMPKAQNVRCARVQGLMRRAQTGPYGLEDLAGRPRVPSTLSVELALPMIGLLRRKAE